MRVVGDIQSEFRVLMQSGRVIHVGPEDQEEGDTLEILNAQFLADESTIFGEENRNHMSDLDFVFSEATRRQIQHCRDALLADHYTRQATMNYQRVSMGLYEHNTVQCFIRPEPMRGDDMTKYPYSHDVGRWRPRLTYSVFMRSNDAVFGYKNDLVWHQSVMKLLTQELKNRDPVAFKHLVAGPIVWHAASLHVYRRHFNLVTW